MPDDKYLSGAVVTAALSFVAKIVYELRAEHQQRRSAAAALLGEIKAYQRTMRGPLLIQGLRNQATAPQAERVAWLKVYPTLPASHPVFDKMADKIGLISPEAAQGVSEIYNVVTGMRILASGFSSAGFMDADNATQKERLTTIANLLEDELSRFPAALAHLEAAVAQEFWSFLCGSQSLQQCHLRAIGAV